MKPEMQSSSSDGIPTSRIWSRNLRRPGSWLSWVHRDPVNPPSYAQASSQPFRLALLREATSGRPWYSPQALIRRGVLPNR